MDRTSRVFFFIKSVDDNKAEVRVPNNAGAGLGEKDTLSVYRPLLLRHKSSFFRSYNGKTASLRKKVQASLRKKAVARQGRQDTVMSYKPVKSEPAWWQQTSTDMSVNMMMMMSRMELELFFTVVTSVKTVKMCFQAWHCLIFPPVQITRWVASGIISFLII